MEKIIFFLIRSSQNKSFTITSDYLNIFLDKITYIYKKFKLGYLNKFLFSK